MGLPAAFHLLIAAQFVSALADNALLIVAIAWLQERGHPAWWAPLLKFSFTLSYVVLAPLIGPLADAVPKARLMAWMNGLKVVGVVGLLLGWNPLLAFAVVGLGAAAYAPAKYGLVTELVPGPRLVAANGWIEVSVVLAAIFGTVIGGLLVADAVRHGAAGRLALMAMAAAGLRPSGLGASLVLLFGLYLLAAGLNTGIPDSGARYVQRSLQPLPLWRDFRAGNQLLWRDALGGQSLAVTTLFWGVGATLQFAVLRWAVEVHGLSLGQAATLQAAVAVGVIGGATFAGRCISLAAATRVLPFGVLLGALMVAVALAPRLAWALPLLVLVGAVGGILVVPMNALLQHRGHTLLTAGRSIAVQGFNENLSVLLMLAVYAGLSWLAVPIVGLMCGFGLAIAAAIAGLMRRQRAPQTACDGAFIEPSPHGHDRL